MEPDPLIGALVGDRYRIVRRVGAGGMAVVYRATLSGVFVLAIVLGLPMGGAGVSVALLLR